MEFSKFWYGVAKWVPVVLVYHVYLLATAAYSIEHPSEEVPQIPALYVIKWLKDGAPVRKKR